LDYNVREDNRVNKPITILMGLFTVTGNFRTSPQADLLTNLQISHSPMPPFQVPMLLIRPAQVVFIPQDQ
jgi:hypothetical protein